MPLRTMETPKFDCHKVIIRRGSQGSEIKKGSKVSFHFKAEICGEPDKDVLDDTRTDLTKPMELVLGKQFKMPVWESCLATMKEGEVAMFTVRKEAVLAYPLIAKTLRDSFGKNTKPKCKTNGNSCGTHRCGMSFFAQNRSTGYPDLDELMDKPRDLKFTFEVLKVESENEYEKEGWIMTDEEKQASIGSLKDKGNTAYKDGDLDEAGKLYSEALTRLDSLTIKEKPGDDAYVRLEEQKLPFLLNLAQCKLIQEEYYAVIELCTMALKVDPENVKAYFRRGKAHIGAWNPREAREDLTKAEELDPKLNVTVKELLQHLNAIGKERNEQDRAKLGSLFAKH